MNGEEVRAIRVRLKMSQQEFGLALGLKSDVTVSRWETGGLPILPSREVAIRALDAFGELLVSPRRRARPGPPRRGRPRGTRAKKIGGEK